MCNEVEIKLPPFSDDVFKNLFIDKSHRNLTVIHDVCVELFSYQQNSVDLGNVLAGPMAT